jgi:3-deoxy-D-manno-octulosonate 8-phosphate phosphatase KdsC-like HAD superfamily phosphatase
MEKSAYSIAPSDAHPLIKQIANFVLKEKGGAGFVRAFIEKIIQFEKLKKDQIYELISNC